MGKRVGKNGKKGHSFLIFVATVVINRDKEEAVKRKK